MVSVSRDGSRPKASVGGTVHVAEICQSAKGSGDLHELYPSVSCSSDVDADLGMHPVHALQSLGISPPLVYSFTPSLSTATGAPAQSDPAHRRPGASGGLEINSCTFFP